MSFLFFVFSQNCSIHLREHLMVVVVVFFFLIKFSLTFGFSM
jgi:hypothetical protein